MNADVESPQVRAQIVWPHEIECANSWLTETEGGDQRLIASARLVLLIASEAPGRTNEFVRLRCGNVIDSGDLIEIEITPSSKHGRLKTKAAQRRLSIKSPRTQAAIRAWLAKRSGEGAASTSLLFGDPSDDRLVYRHHAMVALLLRVLKAATGDPNMSIHALRHGVVTDHGTCVLATSSITDLNRLALKAVEIGHVSAAMSLRAYTHLYEAALRMAIDSTLIELLPINSFEAAALLGIPSATLRQQAKRASIELNEYLWLRVRESGVKVPLDLACAGCDWVNPTRPVVRGMPAGELSVGTTLTIIEELRAGRTAESIASRHQVPVSMVSRVADAVETVADAYSRKCWPRLHGRDPMPASGVASALDWARLDLPRARQPKFRALAQWHLAPRDAPTLRRAFEAWMNCHVGEYLSLAQPRRTIDLLALLREAGVAAGALKVCIGVTGRSRTTGDRVTDASVRADFVSVFGVQPQVIETDERGGRPAAYLLWERSATVGVLAPAASSIAGLDVWMFATGVCLSIKE